MGLIGISLIIFLFIGDILIFVSVYIYLNVARIKYIMI